MSRQFIPTTCYDLISINNLSNLVPDAGFELVVINTMDMTAWVYGAVRYTGDNNTDSFQDFVTLQGFFVGTEPNL